MEDIVVFDGVCKQFDNEVILDNISFVVKEHDVFGYLGPNGAGKTTSIRIMQGLIKQTSGDISIFGRTNVNSLLADRVGFCYDNDGLYDNLTAYENMVFFDKIYNDRLRRKERVLDILKIVDMHLYKDKKVGKFSRGMRKRLGLARALLIFPQLLILDEPMIGLDPEGQECIKDVIKRVNEECTIFISSHNLYDVQELCNNVAIINKSLIIQDTVDNILMHRKAIICIDIKENCSEKQLRELINWQNPQIKRIYTKNNKVFIEFFGEANIDLVFQYIVSNNIPINSVGELENTLRSRYFDILERGE